MSESVVCEEEKLNRNTCFHGGGDVRGHGSFCVYTPS